MTTWDIYFPLFSLTSYAVNLANTLGNIECDIFWPIFVKLEVLFQVPEESKGQLRAKVLKFKPISETLLLQNSTPEQPVTKK